MSRTIWGFPTCSMSWREVREEHVPVEPRTPADVYGRVESVGPYLELQVDLS